MTRPRVLGRWLLVAVACYAGTGVVVWIAAIVRQPGMFGPVEWLIALFWYVVAWPVYISLLLRG